jgi:Succinyl-CoA synthetase, beta subunit
VDPVLGIMPYQTRKLSFALGLNPSLFGKIVSKLYQAYMDLDASLVEINPLVLTKRWRYSAFGCKSRNR